METGAEGAGRGEPPDESRAALAAAAAHARTAREAREAKQNAPQADWTI